MRLTLEPLAPETFAPFGEVLEATGAHALINDGRCRRYTDLATLDIADGRPGVSLFAAEPRSLPVEIGLMERHPLGAQCFLPMVGGEWLVLVAGDEAGAPAGLRAFLARGDQGVNIGRGVWHGVLCPLAPQGATVARLFAVVDRIGAGANLEEHRLDPPVTVAP
ncbi:MAG: Ureidoglycolate hydrolase [Deinococcus-Thermus bacterium]|jgi:ureidoglycolate lyase|nr:Ureidoglycolate hydrolase [Deinococcota bacterium]